MTGFLIFYLFFSLLFRSFTFINNNLFSLRFFLLYFFWSSKLTQSFFLCKRLCFLNIFVIFFLIFKICMQFAFFIKSFSFKPLKRQFLRMRRYFGFALNFFFFFRLLFLFYLLLLFVFWWKGWCLTMHFCRLNLMCFLIVLEKRFLISIIGFVFFEIRKPLIMLKLCICLLFLLRFG